MPALESQGGGCPRRPSGVVASGRGPPDMAVGSPAGREGVVTRPPLTPGCAPATSSRLTTSPCARVTSAVPPGRACGAGTTLLLHARVALPALPVLVSPGLLGGLHRGPQPPDPEVRSLWSRKAGLASRLPGASEGQHLETLSCLRVCSPNPHSAQAAPCHPCVPAPTLAGSWRLPPGSGPRSQGPRAWNGPREVVLAGQGSWVLRATS